MSISNLLHAAYVSFKGTDRVLPRNVIGTFIIYVHRIFNVYIFRITNSRIGFHLTIIV